MPTPRIEPAIKVLPDRIVPPRVRPVIVPRVLPKSDVKITPSYRPALVQPQAIKQIPKTSPRIAPPPMGKPRVPQMPSFRLGGSGGGRGGGDALTGRWFKYKNPVKTPKQVLKDFKSFGGKSRVSISPPKFKQPRINYNLSKQRRKRKR